MTRELEASEAETEAEYRAREDAHHAAAPPTDAELTEWLENVRGGFNTSGVVSAVERMVARVRELEARLARYEGAAPVTGEFLIVSKKWTCRDPNGPAEPSLVWYQPNSAGYCTRLSWAGRYTEAEARDQASDCHGDVWAVPIEEAYRRAVLTVPNGISAFAEFAPPAEPKS